MSCLTVLENTIDTLFINIILKDILTVQSPSQQTPEFESDWALFLDVDGTLLELAAHPSHVDVSKDLLDILFELKKRTNGALALISGRPISELDSLFQPLHICIAGQHGLERRDARDHVHKHPMPNGDFDVIREVLAEFAANHPGVVIEDKTSSISMHYRQASHYRLPLETVISNCMRQIGDNFHLITGKMVFEIKPRGKDKGTAINEFMLEPPFKGRKPVFIGDDVTDEDGFMIVNKLGGYTIKVGVGYTSAKWRLIDARAVSEWLISYNNYLGKREKA